MENKKITIKVTYKELKDIINTFMICWMNNDGEKYPNWDRRLRKYIKRYKNIQNKWIENENQQKG